MASTPEMPAPAGPPKTFIPPIGIGHSKPKLASPPPAPDVSQSSAAKQGGLGKAKGSAEVFDISGGGPKAASHGTAPGQPKSSSAPRAPMDDGDSGEDSEEEEHEKDEICDPLALEPVEEQEKKGRKKPRRIWQLYLTCCFLMGLTVFISMISSGASDGWFTFMAVLSSFPPFLMVIAWARVGSDSKYMPFVIGLPALLFGAYLVYKATADNDPGLAVLMNHILALTIGSTMTVTIDVETLAIPDSRHLTSFFFTTIGHAMISGGARINLDPRVIIMHSFCMFRLIFPDSLRTAITDNKLVHIAVLGLMHYISAESLLTGLGVIRAPFRGENLARPSGYTSLGSFRGKISTQLTVGTAIKDVKMKEGDGVFKFLRASASALTSLPTGSKVLFDSYKLKVILVDAPVFENLAGYFGSIQGQAKQEKMMSKSQRHTDGLQECRVEDEQQVEVISLMQTGAGEALEGPWLELLEEIRLRLEGYGKGERSQVAGHMLRLLDHRATDAASGYLLGHMPGRVSTLTALLVAMRDDQCYGHKVPAGDVKLQWLRQTWDSVTKYIPQHPGSAAAAGEWPSHDMPVIMTFMRPLPEDTPPSSPIQVENSSEQVLRGQQKRRYAQVELSSGSADPPRSVRLQVPLHERTGVLQLRFTVDAEMEPDSPASTVPAGEHTASIPAGGMLVPAGAPGGLDTYGLSANDFEDLRWNGTGARPPWSRYRLSMVPTWRKSRQQQRSWMILARPLRWLMNDLMARRRMISRGSSPGGASWYKGYKGVLFLTNSLCRAQRSSSRWRDGLCRGFASRLCALTSALMELIWRRGDQDYLMEAEGYIEDLGLTMEVDRDRAAELPRDTLGAVEWMEAELWQIFVDELEGAVGETHQVQNARGQATMTPQQCQGWWQWAELVVQQHPRSRSRSPRARDQGADSSSLMETGRSKPMPKRRTGQARGDRRDQDEDDDRGDRRAWARNGLSDGRRRSPERRRSRQPARGASSGARERVRRLGIRGGAGGPPAPMTVGNATCFWLHTLGLRDGLATDDHHALDPEQHSNRVRAVQDIRQEDVLMMMVALMRTMAMFVVESSQLMMNRVGPRGARGDEEVEVEVEDNGDDEEMWMQTTKGVVRKRGLEEGEQLAEDEREAKQLKSEDRNSEEYQLQERAREEEAQEREDEALWQQHLAATYRDWEWWVVQTCPPSRPRRLQASMMVAQGSAGEQVTCSIPLARGRPIDIQLSLREVQVEEDQQTNGLGSGQAAGTGKEENLDSRTMALYRDWLAGRVEESTVQALVGDEMMGMFWAQRMVEEDGDGSQSSTPRPAQRTESGLQPMPHDGLAVVVEQEDMVEQGVMGLPVAGSDVGEMGHAQTWPMTGVTTTTRDGLEGYERVDVPDRAPEHEE
ncbi:zc3hc1 [Symbiodinium sp. KB8]|nr:zc3hc1 [Symbiodinium sp. KB8]